MVLRTFNTECTPSPPIPGTYVNSDPSAPLDFLIRVPGSDPHAAGVAPGKLASLVPCPLTCRLGESGFPCKKSDLYQTAAENSEFISTSIRFWVELRRSARSSDDIVLEHTGDVATPVVVRLRQVGRVRRAFSANQPPLSNGRRELRVHQYFDSVLGRVKRVCEVFGRYRFGTYRRRRNARGDALATRMLRDQPKPFYHQFGCELGINTTSLCQAPQHPTLWLLGLQYTSSAPLSNLLPLNLL
jgi:hypothetical protein